jgi:predicted tellurium resistance membrane protein TerC
MGVAANFIARLLQRFHWIAYGGLAIILWVALDMIYHGSMEVAIQVGVADVIGWWH